MISVVIETWNLDTGAVELDPLAHLLARLAPQVAATGAEVVITHSGIPGEARAALGRLLGHNICWVELPPEAGYYEHKNRGFDAASGDVVAFIDGDCDPAATWLAALVAPFAEGALVVAGATSYPGTLGSLANQIDFPYFDAAARRREIADAPATVRNFFANNVAFARALFAAHRYPELPMFHGQCQVLGLVLLDAHVAIRFAPDARVTHAWPDDIPGFFAVRLLRGADTVSLLPHVLARYAPRAVPIARRLGALPALAIFGARAATATWTAVRRGPLVRGLGFVAVATLLDAVGAVAAPAVYRHLA
jgi:hypothetical protein